MTKKGNGFTRYSTYNFIEKDPIIDVLRTRKRDVAMTDAEIATSSKLSSSTLKNWFGGKTKRPQHATVAAAAVAMGMSWLPITAEARKNLKE